MNRYVVLANGGVEHAEAISAAVFSIKRPPSVRNPGDLTTHWCAWIEHSVDGRGALVIPDTDMLVHPDGDTAPLLDIVSQISTPEVVQGISDTLEGARGSRIVPADVLPGILGSPLKTHEELEADGWFEEFNP